MSYELFFFYLRPCHHHFIFGCWTCDWAKVHRQWSLKDTLNFCTQPRSYFYDGASWKKQTIRVSVLHKQTHTKWTPYKPHNKIGPVPVCVAWRIYQFRIVWLNVKYTDFISHFGMLSFWRQQALDEHILKKICSTFRNAKLNAKNYAIK